MSLDSRYVAGLFDGEGYFGLYQNPGCKDPRYRKGRRGPAWVRQCGINACWLPTLREFRHTFGGTLRRLRKTPGHKTVWSWNLGAKADITYFLQTVIPHLKEKRKQARVMLSVMHGRQTHTDGRTVLKRLRRRSWE